MAIKDRIKKYIKNDYTVLMLGAVCIGALAFFLIYGVHVLNVRYDDWLYAGEDLTQHYFGWLFYRKSDWSFPLGMIQGLSDFDTSVTFMDSIPLLAIFFKLFRNILPETFQYFGIWGLFSYIMMAVVSAKLLHKFSDNKFICWIGSVFFVISPYMLQRMYYHSSLGGQWIIVLAIYFWIDNVGKESIVKKTMAWSCLMGIASTIHIYFVPMTVMFLFADSVRLVLKKKYVKASVCFFCPILVTIGIMGIIGAFSGSREYASLGLGYYSANLNTLFNPISEISRWLKELPHGSGQYEGMGYLGLGIIVLCIVNVYMLAANRTALLDFWKEHKEQVIFGGIICILFGVLALSPTVMWKEKTLFAIKYPEFIMNFLSIFRASGRFIWPICYLIFFLSVSVFIKKNKGWKATVFLACLLILQLADISPLIREKHGIYSQISEYENPLTEEAWNAVLSGKNKVVLLPYNMGYNKKATIYAIGKIANGFDIKFSSFYIARLKEEECIANDDEYRNTLSEGRGEDTTVYIFSKVDAIVDEEYGLNYYLIDGVVVGLTDEIDSLGNAAITRIDSNGAFLIPLSDMAITGTDNGENSTGAESGALTIKPDQILFGPYYSLKAGSYECTVTGENLSNLSWGIASGKGTEDHSFEIISQDDEEVILKMNLQKDVADIEIKGRNLNNSETSVNGIRLKKVE